MPIKSFAPEPFEVVKEIPVVIEQGDEEYLATFYDANVGASGSNEVEAIENLKDVLLSRYDHLDGVAKKKLAPPVAKQIAVLREFIRNSDHLHRA